MCYQLIVCAGVVNHWSERISRLLARLLFMASLWVVPLTAAYALLTLCVFARCARAVGFVGPLFASGLTTVSENTEMGTLGGLGTYSGLSRLGSVAGNFWVRWGTICWVFSIMAAIWVSFLSVPGGAKNRR